MSLSSDNFASLIHLRDKARKWKNISFLLMVITTLLCFHFLISKDSSHQIDSGDYIANISINGVIFDDNYRTSVLEKIAKQDNIKAVIVNIDSPGGGIVGSEILYNSLREISKNKPIVTVMGSLAASGGYMTAIASDYIIARNGTLTGSIGVIMQTSEITELAKKMGIKFISYKSSEIKGSPSPFEKSNTKVNAIVNDSIMDSYQFFSDLVKERRGKKLNPTNIKNILDGRVFTGRQALKNGLIDQIGGKNEAIAYLKNTKKIDTNNLELRDVSLVKLENSLLGKIIGESKLERIMSKIYDFNSKSQLMLMW